MKTLSNNLVKVVELLNDHEFHDGTSIGEKLNITRAAVWKIIKKLEDYNVDIQSVKGKGYMLQQPLILLNVKKIQAHLIKAEPVEIELFEQIDSTNEYLAGLKTFDNKSRICIAEMQTAGKARLQRNWHSPFGQNLYFSFRKSFNKDISELTGISLVIALAVCSAIEKCCPLFKTGGKTGAETIFVKWPNDIICTDTKFGKKLAGILLETKAETNGVCNVTIGIGINVNMQEDQAAFIDQAWTSIINLTGQYQDRNLIAAELINQLTDYLAKFEQHGLNDFLKEWHDRDFLFNRSVRLKVGDNEFSGKGAGINEHGHLLLILNDKTQKSFSSGDTTILKRNHA